MAPRMRLRRTGGIPEGLVGPMYHKPSYGINTFELRPNSLSVLWLSAGPRG